MSKVNVVNNSNCSCRLYMMGGRERRNHVTPTNDSDKNVKTITPVVITSSHHPKLNKLNNDV